jgi:hypothetical protein
MGRVFNFRFGHLHADLFCCYQVKLPSLKLKARTKQLPGSLPLVVALPSLRYHSILLWPLALLKQGRQYLPLISLSFLDVYGWYSVASLGAYNSGLFTHESDFAVG